MMLIAYAISGDTTLTHEAIAELRDVAEGLCRENLPAELTLGFDWESLVPGARVEGTFLRGYQHVANRSEALYVVQCLRRLSERFPDYSFYLSGTGELPMTQLKGGEFELFAETYERALATFRTSQTQGWRRGVRS